MRRHLGFSLTFCESPSRALLVPGSPVLRQPSTLLCPLLRLPGQPPSLFPPVSEGEKNSAAVVLASSLPTDSSTSKAFSNNLMQISQGAVSTQPVKCLFYKHEDLSLFASNSMRNRHGGTCLEHQCYGAGSRRIPGAHWSDRSTGLAMADPVSKNKVEK